MRVVVAGLGIQGRKRQRIAGPDVVSTVDPAAADAAFTSIDQVPPDRYDAVLVCTPDDAKPGIVTHALGAGKHVLVEKPLLMRDVAELERLRELARSTGAALYTAYNHRFEPHIASVQRLLQDPEAVGRPYLVRMFYGNGTAQDVKRSPWRDRGIGVLGDLGSHLLDTALFLFGSAPESFSLWTATRAETRAPDHVVFGAPKSNLHPAYVCEMTMLSWRNTFGLDVFGERGSVHINGLCKWGPSVLTVRRRVLPSGRPHEESETLEQPDPTWAMEYDHFKDLCRTGGTNIDNDMYIQRTLGALAAQIGEEVLA